MQESGTKHQPTPAASEPEQKLDDQANAAGATAADISQEPRSWLGRAFASLRHRNYRLYFFGQMISQTGSWVQITALMWLAFELTHSNRWPAWIAGLHIFPTCLLGPWGGVLADRYPKRWLIFWMQACFMALAVVLAVLVLSGLVKPWHLLVLAAVSGLVNAVDFPARLSFVMEMVGRQDLMNAVGLNASLFNGARAVGPAIGGLMLAWIGPGWCFALNTVTYAGVLIGLARMDIAETVVPAARNSRGIRYVLDGFGYLAQKPRVAWLLVLVGAIGFFGWPFLSLMPAFAHDVLDVRERGYSMLLSATGLGALAAALSVAAFGSIERRRGFIATGVSMIATMLLALSISTRIEAAAVCCGLIGFGLIMFFATCQSVMQLAAEDHNRGRVMGVWSMVVSGAQPLGNFLAGPAADQYGEPIVLRIEGFACALAMVGTIALVYLLDRERLRADSDRQSTMPFEEEV